MDSQVTSPFPVPRQVRRNRFQLFAPIAFAFVATLGLASQSIADESVEARSVVEALYAAFAAGNNEAIAGLIAPEATWTYHGPRSEIPFAGTQKGPEGVGEFFRLVSENLTNASAGQQQILTSGGTVFVIGWEESTVTATGGHYRVPTLHKFEVMNGKIVAFDEFIDSGTVMQAFMPAQPARGQAYFTTCAGCHGNQAQGWKQMHAPALAGQDPNYLLSQLRKFRDGVRGRMDDFHGYMMVGRANALADDRALRDVVSYISTLEPSGRQAAVHSDNELVATGKLNYQSCAACHGPSGAGDPALGAPALNTLDEWYVKTQLEKFRSGIRGGDERDLHGAQMRAALEGVPVAMDSAIATYIQTLSR